MAAPTNLTTTLVSIGNREDLSDTIHRVAPEKTPFLSTIGKGKAKARYHEWQTEDLRAPSATNAQLEGDDIASLNAPNLTARVGNICQIFRETGGVSRTQEVVDKAGRKSELTRQKVLKGIELRRDAEASATSANASVNQSGSTPRQTAGILSWLTSNVSRGVGGASGGFSAGIVAAPTNGTLRNFTEALFKAVQKARFDSSGATDGTVAFMGSGLKQTFSTFPGIAEIRKDVKQGMATVVGAVEVYVSDFGEVKAVPHPYAFSRDCVIIEPDKLEWAMLDGYQTEELAKTGDSERFMMTMEGCLVVKNQKAHGVVADIQAV